MFSPKLTRSHKLRNYEGAKPERLEELILQLFVVGGLLAMILGREDLALLGYVSIDQRFKHVETLAKVWQCLPLCSSTGAAKEVLRHWFLLQAAGSKEGIGTRSGAASEPSRYCMRLVANITRLIMRVVAQDLVLVVVNVSQYS